MAVETFKKSGSTILKELVPPEFLEGQLKGGWYLSKKAALKAENEKAPEEKKGPEVKPDSTVKDAVVKKSANPK